MASLVPWLGLVLLLLVGLGIIFTGLPAAIVLIGVASIGATIGVVIPPSLVLILLGDAMLSAHTIAVTSTGRTDRVINTQDVFHGALAPAALFLVLSLIVAWLVGRRLPATKEAPDDRPTQA